MTKPVRLMLILILGIACLLAVLAGGYLYLHKHRTHSDKPKVLTVAQQAALQIPLAQMTTDLRGSGLAQVSVVLQASDAKTKGELTLMQPAIQDLLNQEMRQYSTSQLRTDKGLVELKAAIRQSVNRMLSEGKVTKVYIPQIIVQ